MDFRRIQHFVHVAELGSLSKAAERLNICLLYTSDAADE